MEGLKALCQGYMDGDYTMDSLVTALCHHLEGMSDREVETLIEVLLAWKPTTI